MSISKWLYLDDLKKMSKKELRKVVSELQLENLYFREQLNGTPLIDKPIELKNPLCLSCGHGRTIAVPTSEGSELWFVGCDKYDCECSGYEPKK